MKIQVSIVISLVLLGGFLHGVAQQYTEIVIVSDKHYVDEAPDVLPKYPGGIDALIGFLSQNLVYPREAVDYNFQDKVVVKFVVNAKGDIESPEIVSGRYPALNQEALRVVSLLNGFKPGQKNGKAVNTWFTLPISFKLGSGEDENDSHYDAVPTDSLNRSSRNDRYVDENAGKE